MISITIHEAQHNLSRVLKDVEAGHSVEIRRRKAPVARLVPANETHGEAPPVDWSDHGKSMADLWGKNTIRSVDSVMSDVRGDR